MKNITLAVDDETYRSARIRAAELDTSVSALVRDYLRLLTGQKAEETQAEDPREETVGERRRRLLREVVADFDARGQRFPGADTLSGEGVYERAVARVEAQARRRRKNDREPRS